MCMASMAKHWKHQEINAWCMFFLMWILLQKDVWWSHCRLSMPPPGASRKVVQPSFINDIRYIDHLFIKGISLIFFGIESFYFQLLVHRGDFPATKLHLLKMQLRSWALSRIRWVDLRVLKLGWNWAETRWNSSQGKRIRVPWKDEWIIMDNEW